MRVSYVFCLPLVFMLSGCRHNDARPKDTSTFGRRMECAELATSGKWESLPNGPFLDNTFYSSSLDTCVFVMKRSHRGEKDGGIHNEVFLIDALTRKQLWANDPEKGETEDQLNASLNDELKQLKINP